MITSKSQLKEYIEQDRVALKRKQGNQGYLDDILNYQILLRYREYYYNTGCRNLQSLICRYRLRRLSRILGFNIHPNVFGPGLRILHAGTIIVNPHVKVGENCTINAMVQIGPGKGGSPQIGDNCYIGPGAKILGGIVLGDNVRIGANAVVTKSFPEGNGLLVGVPAKPKTAPK